MNKNVKVLLIGIFLVFMIALPTFFLLQSTFELPENDVWVRNRNLLNVDGVLYTEDHDGFIKYYDSECHPEIIVDMSLKVNYNNTLDTTYFICLSYQINSITIDEFSGDISEVIEEFGTIEEYCNKDDELIFQIDWIMPIVKIPQIALQYQKQYVLTITDITFIVNNITYYLTQAQQIRIVIAYVLETNSNEIVFSVVVERIGDKDLMLFIDDSDNDSDLDGIPDETEIKNGTNPLNPDTDGDGLLDSAEITCQTDPNSWDSDGDGFSDYLECEIYHTDPNNDSDFPNISDLKFQVVNLYFWLLIGLVLFLSVCVILLIWRIRKKSFQW